MAFHLTGTLRIPKDLQSELLPLLDDHIAATRDEPGCRSFDVTQDKNDPETFHLAEIFDDEDAFAFHQKRGGASPWGIAAKDLERDFTTKIT